MATAGPPFQAYHLSHWSVLVVAVLGACGLVVAARRSGEGVVRAGCRALAVLVVALDMTIEWWVFRPEDALHTLPLQLSDLAPYLAGIALWTRRRWAYRLAAYWCLTLSTQALLTPVLRGADFPSLSFLAFFANHVLVVWAAAVLVWGLDLRPDRRDYRLTLAVTTGWAAVMVTFNALAGTDYGFLNAKPSTGSVLDLLGPWPWYLLSEFALVAAAWAALTRIWRPRPVGSGPGGSMTGMPGFLDSLPPLLARALRSLRRSGTPASRPAVRDLPTAQRSRRIAYAPDPDGGADPGEIVWAWVPFEEHDGRGKDRPLLVVGRDGDGGLLGLMLSSQHDRADDRDWVPIGSGGWDRAGRESFVRLDRVLELSEQGIRREGSVLPRDRFDRVAGELRDRFGWS